MTDTLNLPELPPASYDYFHDYYEGWTAVGHQPRDRNIEIKLFTEDDMRAYATAAVLAERERAARICETTPAEAFCTVMHRGQLQRARETFASAIRLG
jgi:hypothetical protein